MITRRMEDNLEQLKYYFNTKFNKQEESLIKTFNNIIADYKKEITKEIEQEVSKQCKQLDSENKMLKKQILEMRELNINDQSRNEELEQYGRHLSLRIDGVPTVKNESSHDVLEFIKSLFKEAKVPVPYNVLDRAHRIDTARKTIFSKSWNIIESSKTPGKYHLSMNFLATKDYISHHRKSQNRNFLVASKYHPSINFLTQKKTVFPNTETFKTRTFQ